MPSIYAKKKKLNQDSQMYLSVIHNLKECFQNLLDWLQRPDFLHLGSVLIHDAHQTGSVFYVCNQTHRQTGAQKQPWKESQKSL